MKLRSIFAWIGLAPLVMTLLTLIPASGAGAADAPPITVDFDHHTTGFELEGVHRELPCESCHLNAIFKGTPRNCGTCHISGSQFNATPKTVTHIPSTNKCAACHNTISFRPQVHFDHAEVLGSCVSCHNGRNAQGKDIPTHSRPHPRTNDVCEACHTVMSWNPPKVVDHTQIPLAVEGFCIICHNGVDASGKSKNHIATNLECGDCHLTTTWLGANFDHTGIVNGCSNCHNGVKAVGKQGSHMPTTNLCESCHTTGIGTKVPSWAPSKFDHTQMTVTTCNTCHSGTVKITTGFVSTMPTNHVPPIPASNDCGVCHGNSPSAETWDVLAASIPVLHTGFLTTNNCLQCHGGQTFAGKPAPYIPMSISGVSPTKATPLAPPHIPVLAGTDCSACHGAAYNAGGFGPATAMSAATHAFVSSTCDTCHDTGKSFYVGSGTPLQLRPLNHVNSTDPRMVTGDCSACHETKDWLSSALPVGHMPNPGSQTCATCHASAPSDYTAATLAAISVLHTGISGNCGLCHGDTSTALTWANNFTPKDAMLTPSHIPYLSGSDCSSCHAASYVLGGFGPTNMSAAKHAFVPTSCDTCHEAGLNFFLGASTPPLQGRPAGHLSSGNPQQVSGDCSACHSTTDWTSTVLPPGHMPNPGNQTCAVCHIAITSTAASYATLASISVLHTGITGSCAQCHGNTTTQLTFFNNTDNPKAAILTPSHIPYLSGSDCSSCHAASYVLGGFGPTNMSAAKHAFVPTSCDTCHEAGLNFYLGTSTPALQPRPPNHLSSSNAQMVSGDCSVCHNTTDWKTTVLPVGHMPNPGSQGCAVCHTAITSAPASYQTLASVAVLHTGITGNCALCHGKTTQLSFYNNSANPKAAANTPTPHIPYLNGTDCSSCHATNYVTGGFGPTNMSPAKHAFVPTTCDTCHDKPANLYLGASTPTLQLRPLNHTSTPNPPLQATGDCSLCHNTTLWTTPTTLPNGHMPIPGTQTCSVCHIGNLNTPAGYLVFASTPVLHTGITTGCAQCHGGNTALSFVNQSKEPLSAAKLSPPHIPAFAGTDCSSCHAPNYVAGGFGPMNMTQATHAGVASGCVSCHEAGKSFFMGAANPLLQGRPLNHTAGQQVAPNECSLCHTTANWITTVLPAGHMPNPASQACNVCHTAAPANYVTLAANSVIHTGITGNCAQCHGVTQLTFYNNSANPKSAALAPAHIPFLSGTDCGACHSSSSYAVGTFGPMNMSVATHSFVTTTCVTCHEKGRSFSMGAANPALQPRPTTGSHVSGPGLTGDCSVCHTTKDWTTTALPTGHMPNPANQACAVCHIAIPTYTTLAANAVMHTGVTSGQCAQCHGGFTALTWTNNFTPKDAVLTPAHIPFLGGTSCGSCHSSSSYAIGTFGPMNMSVATHSFVTTTCVTCHEKGRSFSMGAANPGLQPRPATGSHVSGQGLTGDCSACHTTKDWSTTSVPVGHMPNPASQGCSVCHVAIPNYKTLATSPVLHTGISSGCITCHGAPNAASPVFAVNFTPKSAGQLAPPHIPTGSTACENCHSGFTSFSGTTMNVAKHSAMFAVIGTTCDACHDVASTSAFYPGAGLRLTIRTSQGNNHFVGRDCSGSGCHVTSSWSAGHKQNGAQPKTRSKIASVVSAPITQRRQVGIVEPRESGVGRLNAVRPTVIGAMTHAGVSGNCISCHNGTLATGKGTVHIASNNACENCHTTIAWLPAHFDHQGVTTSCVSCHNGASAPGKPLSHMHTAGDCGVCHGTVAWRPVTFSHVGINATCQSCHNGITAVGKQIQHVITTLDCSTCHNTLSWTLVATPKPQLKPLLPPLRRNTPRPGPRDTNGSNQ